MSTDPMRDPMRDPLRDLPDGASDADGADVAGALATLLTDEPPLRGTVEDAERAGRVLLARRRRRRAGAAGGVFAAGVAALLAAGPVGQLAAGPAVPSPPAATSSPPAGASPDGAMQPVGFPAAEAVAAVQAALPAGVVLADLPPDIGWRPAADGGVARLTVPLAAGAGGPAADAVLSLGAPCTLSGAGALLDADAARAVADAVCGVWAAWGSPDPLAPVPDPGVPPDPAS